MEEQVIETIETEAGTVCRLCMKRGEVGSNLDGLVASEATDTGSGFKRLRDIMTQICQVTVESGDGLPETVCELCKEGLLAAYKLQLTAQHTDSVLRKVFHDPEKQENKAKKMEIVYEFDDEVGHENKVIESVLENELQCEVCGKEFENQSQLEKHWEVHKLDPKKPFQCVVCYQTFHIEATLNLHMQIHEITTGEPPEDNQVIIFQCPECDYEFMSQEAFDEHWKEHLEPELQTIYDVPMEEEEEHQEQIDDDVEESPIDSAKKISCMDCPSEFDDEAAYYDHLTREHSGEGKTIKCSVCFLSFREARLFYQHQKCHQEVEGPQCDECGMSFLSPTLLNKHIQKKHEVKSKFKCDKCEKSFPSQDKLTKHQAKHSGEKPLACPMCPGRYANRASLVIHIRTHTGEKPYKCPDCPAAFNTHFSMTKHKRTHTGERPYVCEVCGLGFNSSYHVRRHLRTHTGDKPYACNFCDRKFAQSNDLVKHKRLHVGKLTYQCTECLESFRLSAELKEHTRQHFLEKKRLEEGETQQAVEIHIV